MIQKWSRYALLQFFFDFPRKDFLIRELSRDAKLAASAVRIHLKELMADGLILKEKKGLYPTFSANSENDTFKLLKAQNLVLRLHGIGAIDTIEKSLYPGCMVLFGSSSRGEDRENSDVDVFVQSKSAPINMSSFEKKINRKINIIFEPDLKTLSPQLLNNLANGIVLYGYLKVV